MSGWEAAMSVRAKFFVQSVTHTSSGGSVKLSAVCRGEDNKTWASYTPSGTIDLMTINQDALDQFKPGDEFYVDFTAAPKDQEG